MKVLEYPLVEPLKIERKESEISDEILPKNSLVKTILFGICGSDVLYFTGQKDPEKLKKRLPLILGHEGVGVVEKSNTFRPGTRVVFIPLDPCGECRFCRSYQENLCQNAKFMASTAPGLARTHLVYKDALLKKIPENVSFEIASLTEPLSIAFRATYEAEIASSHKVLVLGTGALGFLIGVCLSYFHKIPIENLYFVGRRDYKVSLASHFATPFNRSSKNLKDLFGEFDRVFECTGGEDCPETVPLSVNLTKKGGKTVLLGLYDGEVRFNSWCIDNLTNFVNSGQRRILKDEKTVMGSSRSRISDYQVVLERLADLQFREKYLNGMIHQTNHTVKGPSDLIKAFQYVSEHRDTQRVLCFLSF